ncbi:MAG: hypothetical protein DMF60_20220, partial [Acidobacteria bacterium]
DGRRHEWITITFYKEAVNHNFQGLGILYFGPDEELRRMSNERPNLSLNLAEVEPLLEKWGFRKH